MSERPARSAKSYIVSFCSWCSTCFHCALCWGFEGPTLFDYFLTKACRLLRPYESHTFQLGGGNSNIFGIFTPILGGRIQFDDLFQMGWNLKAPSSSHDIFLHSIHRVYGMGSCAICKDNTYFLSPARISSWLISGLWMFFHPIFPNFINLTNLQEELQWKQLIVQIWKNHVGFGPETQCSFKIQTVKTCKNMISLETCRWKSMAQVWW